ncbi:hypothetical protein TrLO_g1534 [Triparma laevis f. longispina]|uniref:F-box/LRR-repeat protein 15-like leucin rich repeat domain-containing protein n=1 Tax=Triparma laevis f. longispina TaxID=1714387 RepID=A0A9W7FSB3_9STRA|nr:hypothetical protein TrLO_g1534 [Triparma laevis f. longispina]
MSRPTANAAFLIEVPPPIPRALRMKDDYDNDDSSTASSNDNSDSDDSPTTHSTPTQSLQSQQYNRPSPSPISHRTMETSMKDASERHKAPPNPLNEEPLDERLSSPPLSPPFSPPKSALRPSITKEGRRSRGASSSVTSEQRSSQRRGSVTFIMDDGTLTDNNSNSNASDLNSFLGTESFASGSIASVQSWGGASQSPSQPRAPRPSGQFPEFLDEVHFPNQLLYYDEAMTIPVTSRAPSKFHSDLNNRRICNTDASIDMSTYPTTNIELASIAASGNGPHAKSLLLPNNKDLSDHGFLLLNKYTHLTQLDIQGCSYLGDACAVLIRHSMPKMKHLDISETSITDVGIEDIMIGCRWISTLNIRDNQHFKDKGCGSVHQSLKSNRNLRNIDFSGSRCFSNEALIQLLSEGGGVLTDITLERCTQINDLGLMGLRRFGKASMNLKTLQVSGLPIHDSSMTWISEGCKKLEVLDLQHTHGITDASLSYLAQGCTKLRTLNLKGCLNISNVGLQNFLPEGGKSLTNLDLTDCSKINDQGAFCIAENSTRLVMLNLFGVPHITDHGMERIAARCIKLSTLDFSADINSLDTTTKARVPHIGGEGLIAMGKYSTKLKEITCKGAARVDDPGIVGLSAGCLDLESVCLRYCYQISSVAVIALATNCKNLLKLDIGSCVGVSEEAIEHLSNSCFALKEIDFLGLRKITDKSFVPFAKSHPNLERVSLQGCDMLGDASIVALSEATKLNLLHLDINSVDDVTDVSLHAIIKNNWNMRSGDFTYCSMTDNTVLKLAEHLPYSRKVGGKRAFKPIHKAVVSFNMQTQYLERLNKGQTKLAVYIRTYLQKRYFQKMKAWKISMIVRIQKVMRGKLGRMRVARIRARNLLEWNASIPIQHCYRAYREQKFAVALVANKRIRYHAAKKIQNQWRVHLARNSMKMMKFRLFKIGKKFRRLIRKIVDRDSYLKRLLATQKLQKWWRYWVELLREKKQTAAILKIQNCWRCFLARKKYDDKLGKKLKMFGVAARGIQIGWAMHLLWVKQITRVRIEEEEFKNTYFTRVKSACIIQKEWRSYKDMGAARTLITYKRLQKRCAVMIQNAWRCYMAKTAAMRAGKYKKWLMICWATFVRKYLYKYRSGYAAKIQRMVRTKLWWERRKTSVRVAQRIVRGHLGRCVARAVKYARDSENGAILIQYIFRKYVKRLRMEEAEWDDECAAKIQRKWRRYKEWKAYKKLMHEIYEQKAKAAQLEKEALERQRQAALLARLFEKGESRAARQIQTAYRKYIHKKRMAEKDRIANERRLRDQKEEAERMQRLQDRKKHKGSFVGKISDGLHWAGSHLNWMTSKYDPNGNGQLDERDAEKRAKAAMKPARTGLVRAVLGADKKEIETANEVWDNSILNRQTRSIESEGILGMKITIGNGELFAFKEEQKANVLARQPIWKMINTDLSGRKKDKVFMWILRGVGKEVFTTIELAKPPDNYDNWQVQKSRHSALEMIGIFVIWHKLLKDLELHCGAAVMAGKSAPPIDFIEITTDLDEHEKWKAADYVMVEPDLAQYGLGRNVNIWYHTKKFVAEPKLHKVTCELLGQYQWFDSRLDTTMEAYGLRPDTVLELHRLFGKMDYKGNNVADVVEFFDMIGENRSVYGDWLLRAIDTDSVNQITFSEFVNIVAVYCMFGNDELLRFMFGMYDEERKSYLDRDQWEKLIIIMMKFEKVPHSKKHWNKEYDNFATTIGKKGSGEPEMFYDDFAKMIKTYPMIAFPMFRMQERMRKCYLGEKFWIQQRQLFVEARARLQVRRK